MLGVMYESKAIHFIDALVKFAVGVVHELTHEPN